MAQYGFSLFIKTITRPVSNIYLNYIFIKTKSLANLVPIIVNSYITDHYSNILTIDNIIDNRNNEPNPLKILKTGCQKLSNSIENHNWSEILKFAYVNKATQYFISTINNLNNQASA